MTKKYTKKKQKWNLERWGKHSKIGFLAGMGGCILLFVGMVHYLTASYNYNYMLKTEEQSLFLYAADFFYECMQRAGGLLTYAGCFLTQFFYDLQLGSVVYMLVLLGVVGLTFKAFQLQWIFFPLAFIPALMLLWSYTNLGYLIFVLKSPGYVFSNPLGVVCALGALWAYRSLEGWKMRAVFIGIYGAVAYPLGGFYVLFGALLCFLYEGILCLRGLGVKSMAPLVTNALITAVVPYLYYRGIYTRMLESDLYISGLPRFYFTKAELPLWMPFIGLFLFLLLLLVIPAKNPGGRKKVWCAAISFFLFGVCVESISVFLRR